MKKIIMINSSFRKKTTYSLLKRIEVQLKDLEVEFINLRDYDIRSCTGCENCLRKGKCYINDDAEKILSKMSQADGIILGTPVYLRQISGSLKNLIDRGCAWYHRSPLVGKPILFVTSTQVTGSKQTVRYLNDVSIQWGTINTGAISRKMFNIDKDLNARELKKFLYYLNDQNKKTYRPGIKKIFEFHTQRVLAVNILPLDLEYWTEKGYLDKPYYFDCRISLLKRILGYLYDKMLTYFILRNKKG